MMNGIINQHQPRTSKELNYDGSLIQVKKYEPWNDWIIFKTSLWIFESNFVRFVISRTCSPQVGENWLRILNETWALQAITRLCCSRLCENHSNYDTRGSRITLRWTEPSLGMIWAKKREENFTWVSFFEKLWTQFFIQAFERHKLRESLSSGWKL